MDLNIFIRQLDDIIKSYNQAKTQCQFNDFSDLDTKVITSIIAKAKSSIARISGLRSEYYKQIQFIDKSYVADMYRLAPIIGVIEALRYDLANNYLISYGELIRSEVFANYFEMSKYLASEGYKDAAAVLIGSTLEAHLRELCKKFSVNIEKETTKGDIVTKKASMVNSDLYKANAYSLTINKQITAWLDIRNNAAHGKYDQYSIEEVRIMIDGIQNFILSNPA